MTTTHRTASGGEPTARAESDRKTQAGQSTTELVATLAEQIPRLMREELDLARAEMTLKARRAGAGSALLAVAGVVALFGVGVLLVSIVTALALVLPVWASALLVAVVLLAAAGVMALLGRAQLRRAGKPVPEQTIESVKTDVQTVAEAAKERGQR